MTDLINLAREIQREADKWAPQLAATGELDQESYCRMVKLRRDLLSAHPETALDRLMKFGAIRSLIGFMLILSEEEPDDAGECMALMQAGLLEVLLGLTSLLRNLETDAEQSLTGLGLFTDEGRLQ